MTHFAREEFFQRLREIERKWQDLWERDHVFEPEVDERKPKFFITVPYPYTSGPLHIGHARTYTIGDVHARYMRLKGYNVLFPMAFHITGTPIESVSFMIAHGDKEAIDLYKSYVRIYINDEEEIERIVQSFTDPWNVMKFFSSVIIRDFKSVGFSIDWRRRFTTGDKVYNSFVRWQFTKLMDKGYITRGTHPVLYDILEDQVVGEDDIKGGDEIKPEIIEFTAVKFRGENEVFVAATLRPETVFGVTNIWINPDAEYVELDVNGERWIVSKEAEEKIKRQGWPAKTIRIFKGSDLIDRLVETPDGRKVPVLPAEFVDPDQATGVVYSVPAHAPYDLIALMDLGLYGKIKPIKVISIEGYSDFPAEDAIRKHGARSQRDVKQLDDATDEIYKEEFYRGVMAIGPFAGEKVSEVKQKVISWLVERGHAFTFYEVKAERKPVLSRAGGKVIAAVLRDQWFINYDAPGWKDLAWKALNSMEIIPQIYRRNFEEAFNWVKMRPCARKRGIGTRLPFDEEWIIESLSDSTIYMALYTVMHRIRSLGIEEMDNDFWDYVFLGNGDPEAIAKKLGVKKEDLEGMRREFLYWYPVDMRHTAIAHISNHLTFFIFHHVAIFPEELWPRKITLNDLVIREGEKMAKSKGNVIPLANISRNYSADWFRLYVVSAADLKTVLDWREEEMRTVGGRLEKFFRMAEGIIKMEGGKGKEIMTKWFITRVNKAIKEVDKYYSSHMYREAVVRGFFDMMRDFETYMRYGGADSAILKDMLSRWIRIISPVIPHTAEELWQMMGEKGYVSAASWPEAGEVDEDVELAFEMAESTVEDVNKIIRTLKTKPKKLYIYVAPEWKYELASKLSKLRSPIDPKEAFSIAKDHMKMGEEARKLVEEFIKGQGMRFSRREYELKILLELKDMIKERTGVDEVYVIEAEKAEYDPKKRAKLAIPGRPALYIE